MSKVYVDQAVQTEPPRHLSRSDDPRALNVHPPEHAYSQPSQPAKPSQLGQLSKPSGITLQTKRVVSLPESSPPQRLKPTADRFRASLSEGTTAEIKLLASGDSSLSSECFETSISIENSQSSSDIPGNRSQRRSSLVSISFPRTPSPPSSPESSVLIIGNHVQVSSTFLRPNTGDEDEGWITWADSPPRPIPALHGPLSLPYARCPSGAEGTLVEGEDLSRMIWGLREEEMQPSASRQDHEEVKNSAKDSPEIFSPPLTLHYPKPPSLVSSSPVTHFHQALTPSTAFPSPDIDLRWYEPDNYDDSPIIIPPTPQQVQTFLEFQRIFQADDMAEGSGLGLFWKDAKPVHHVPNLAPRLQASARAFIPGTVNRQQPEPPRIAANAEMRELNLPRRRTASAIDLATEYLLQHQAKNSLITPPNSTSTTWTPRFPGRSPILTQHSELFDELVEKDSPAHLPADVSSLQDSSDMRLHTASSQPTARHEPRYSHPSPTIDVPPSPQSPEVRLRSTGPQPRSVPFARLLQRRLSAVPEEESTQRAPTGPSGRPLSNRRPGFQNGASAPNKPYFAQGSNPPDVPSKLRLSSSPPPGDPSRVPRSKAETTSVTAPNPPSNPPDSDSSNLVKHKPGAGAARTSKENVPVKSGVDVSSKGAKKRGRNRGKK